MRKLFAPLIVSALLVAGCSDNALDPTANAADELDDTPEMSVDFETIEEANAYRLTASKNGYRTYEVTIENLTDGQPFSPPIMMTHNSSLKLFTLGNRSTKAIKSIAENGDNTRMRSKTMRQRAVADAAEGTAPLVPAANPGGTPFSDTASYELKSFGNADRLSAAWMLICTNDGFSGTVGLDLPENVGESAYTTTAAYDAGTEINTEDFANIVPPCQGLIGVSSDDPGIGMTQKSLRERSVVAMHAGINGGDDLLPEVHGWDNPVGKITVTRID